MSGALCAMIGGAGGRILTVHGRASGGDTFFGYNPVYGGSLTPTEFLSTNIDRLEWGTDNVLYLGVTNTSLPNSGWTTININGTTFLRTSASYASGLWQWTSTLTNPFGITNGAVMPVNIA